MANGIQHLSRSLVRAIDDAPRLEIPDSMTPFQPSITDPPASPSASSLLEICRLRLLEYPPIQRSGKLRTLLEYLIRHADQAAEPPLDQYRIAFDCFRMEHGFDANHSSLVRVHLSKLRKSLHDYAESAGKQDPLRITLPVGSYALRIARNTPSNSSKSRPVLALVEFRSIGLEEEWKLLPALISEQLGDRISKSGNFDFMGPFSRHMMGTDEPDLQDLARKHDIDCFIDGHVHGLRKHINLGLRIIDASSGQVTWTGTESFGIDRISIDGIGDELLGRLASIIGADYGGVDAHFSRLARIKPEHSLSVYEAVLLGRMYFADFNPRALSKAIPRLRDVVQMHPDEALPKATLAMLLANAGHEPRWPELPPSEEIRLLARDAWRLAPEDPWSILAFGFAACFGGDGHEIRRLAIALEGDTNAAAIAKCGIGVLMCLRCIDDGLGLRLICESRRMNPYQPCAVHVVEALVALRRGDLDGAISHLDIYRIPWGWADPLIRGAVYSLRGQTELAAGEYRAVLAAFPDFEQAALEEGRLIWHREHIEFLIGTFFRAGISAASCQ